MSRLVGPPSVYVGLGYITDLDRKRAFWLVVALFALVVAVVLLVTGVVFVLAAIVILAALGRSVRNRLRRYFSTR